MCLALVHLHSHGIAHLDVKPDNIYTWGEFEGERDMARVYKLGDFGQATRFDCRQAMNVIEGDSRWAGRLSCLRVAGICPTIGARRVA